MNTTNAAAVGYDRHGFIIDGRRRFLLAGTVSYFRLNRGDWEARLRAVQACGLNTIDMLVAWNYHEEKEGEFDFATGNRDLGAYLELCKKLGLWVYLRPGPYTCNEWDGGGLPSWLYVKPEVRLRQNEENYLRYAKRFLSKVYEIARPYLHTRGGPVILCQLENELDFFACDDVAGHMGALRDHARAEGIDVPLTACIGQRTHVRQAMGFVEGIIPSPNIYAGGMVEREAAHALRTVLCGEYRTGELMANVPAFVTETGRDAGNLRRILSAGFKEIGPFNVCGGTAYGYWNSTNDWGGFTFTSSTVDFGGQVKYDGRYSELALPTRQLAGFLKACEEQLLECDPITSWDGGPGCSNKELGAREDEKAPGRVYSLVSRDGETAFVFLFNGTEQGQETVVSLNRRTWPVHSKLVVSRKYDHIVVAGLKLEGVGVKGKIKYCTGEIYELRGTGEGAEMVVYGETGTEGEMCLASGEEMGVVEGTAKRFDGAAREMVLVFGFGGRSETRVRIGGRVLRIVAMSRDVAGREGLGYEPGLGEAVDLLAGAWRQGMMARPEWERSWEGAGRAMETLGCMQGAGWYELAFEDGVGGRELVVPHGGDVLSVYMDERYVGTYLCTGGPLAVDLGGELGAGAHRLGVRAEIWGHANFERDTWPSGCIGSLRGVWGVPTLNGQELAGTWRFGAQAAPGAVLGKAEGLMAVKGGEQLVAERVLEAAMPRGAVIEVEGVDCHGEVRVNGVMVGRYVMGPGLVVKIVGGPGNRFYVPGELLNGKGVLTMTVRGTSDQAKVTRVTIEAVK